MVIYLTTIILNTKILVGANTSDLTDILNPNIIVGGNTSDLTDILNRIEYVS